MSQSANTDATTGSWPVVVPRDAAEDSLQMYEIGHADGYRTGFHDGRLVGRDEAFAETLAAPRVTDEWLPADAMARRLGEMERPR